MKKLALLLLAMCLLFSIASAEGQRVISFWDTNPGEVATPLWQELIADFEAENPDIKVEYTGIPYTSSYEKIEVAIASDSLPDVTLVSQNWIANFVYQDALLPLDEMLPTWDEASQINSGVLDSIRTLSSDGLLYEMPITGCVECIWVRSDVLEEKGITINTWEDFFNAVPLLTDKDKGIYGFSIRGGNGSIDQLTSALFAYSNIPSYFDENGVCQINDPRIVEFLDRFDALYNTYTPESDINSGYAEMIAAFDSGVAMMICHNLGSYGEHLRAFGDTSKFKALSLPNSLDGNPAIKGGDNAGLSIFSSTKDPEAAWRFVSYIASHKATSKYNEAIGQLPVNALALKDDWIQQNDHTAMGAKLLASEDMNCVMLPLFLPNYNDIIINTLEPAYQELLLGEMTTKEFLDMWSDEMTKAYAAYLAEK